MTQATFWDGIAPKYAKQPIKDLDAYEQTMERVRDYLSPSDRVVELGCGTGATALKLAPHAAHITGTDISPGMIAQANTRLKGGENVSFRTATPDALTDLAGKMDVVTAFNLIHLIPDTEALVAQAATLLKPGGLFITKTPCLAHFNRLLMLAIPVMQFFGKAPYIKRLSITELEGAISFESFDIIETGSYPAKPPSRFIVARKR